MIRNSFLVLIIVGFGMILFSLLSQFRSPEALNEPAAYYVGNGPAETGAANVVTSVVVTYRGFDTLGEVTILFLAASIVGFMFKNRNSRAAGGDSDVSEILSSSSGFLVPLIIVFGVYVFVNGHLTPGGGFQGGAIIASALLLMILSGGGEGISHRVMNVVESISGFGFVVLGVAGLLLAGGFLDNRFLPAGTLGSLFSAGAIPLIYILVGLKVGAELTGIIVELNQTGEETEK